MTYMDKNFALGFLTAAIDGEGSFMLKPITDKRVLRKGRKSLSVLASMEIENTSEAFIDKVEVALKTLELGSFRIKRNFRSYDKVSYYKRYGFIPHASTVLGGGKNYYRLAITKRRDMVLLIDLLKNELTARKAAVEIVSEFLSRTGGVHAYAATREDLELCAQLSELQGRRRKPFPMDKWLACLAGDYAFFEASQRRAKPGNAEVYPEGVETSG